MKILQKKQLELLPRIEITAEEEHNTKPTPSKSSIQEGLSKELKIDQDLIVIKHIYSGFGEGKSKIIAYAYKDKASLKRIEAQKRELKENAEKKSKEQENK